MELDNDRSTDGSHRDHLKESAHRGESRNPKRVEPDDIDAVPSRRSGHRHSLRDHGRHVLQVEPVGLRAAPFARDQANGLVAHLGKGFRHLVGHRGDAAAAQRTTCADDEYLHATSMTAHDYLPGDLDVIVVSWNSAPHLGATLAALPSWAHPIIADNASRDGSVYIARAHGAQVIEMGRNAGYPVAVNAGLTVATAPLVLLLNPDIVVSPGSLEQCLEVLIADPTVGLVGPATTTPDGRPEPAAARRDRRAGHILLESLGLVHLSRRLDRQMVHNRSRDRDVDAVNGAFMLMRTDLLRELGGLDETVFMYLEDADLCRRVRDAGFRVRFVAGAGAVHEGGASTARGDTEAQARAYLHRIDADVEFLRRYGSRGEAGLALAAFVLRSLLGLAVSVARPARRTRYRASLRFALRQRRGRQPPENV